MLTVRELSVRYGGAVLALKGVSLEVGSQGVVAVLGGNGAGKSTLLRAISGTLPLHRGAVINGTVEFDGVRIDRLKPAAIVRRGVVGVPEGRQIFTKLTVAENLRAGGIGARSKQERAAAHQRVHELFPVLSQRAHQRAGLLSGGEQQMLAIGRALMSGPRLLLLDEPSLGLAPKAIGQVGEIIREIHAQGTAVVLVEQNATMALRAAEHAVVLETGSVALSGSSAELAASEDVRELYLGGHAHTAAATAGAVPAGAVPADAAPAGAEPAKRPARVRELARWAG